MHVAAEKLSCRRLAMASLCVIGLMVGCRQTSFRCERHQAFPIPGPASEIPLQGGVTAVPASNPFAVLDTYALRPNDQIGFALSFRQRPAGGENHIGVGDRINVEYLHVAAEERRPLTLRVKQDGNIDLHLVGAVEVAGKTVAQATDDVNEAARRYWKHPQISLVVSDVPDSANELSGAFSVEGSTNPRLMLPVGPDGTLELPVIGTVHAFGRTLPDIREEINQRFQADVPGVEVTPYLVQRAPDRVYVLGEVAEPGMLELEGPTTVIQAIARAGSWTPAAQLREVTLVRGYTEGSPRAMLLDVDRAINRQCHREELDATDDVWLQDGDIVVVPKDHLGQWEDFIGRLTLDGR